MKSTVTEDRPAARACFHCYPTALRNSRNGGRAGWGTIEDDASNSSTRPESPGEVPCSGAGTSGEASGAIPKSSDQVAVVEINEFFGSSPGASTW
jgi:hypothetical protein